MSHTSTNLHHTDAPEVSQAIEAAGCRVGVGAAQGCASVMGRENKILKCDRGHMIDSNDATNGPVGVVVGVELIQGP